MILPNRQGCIKILANLTDPIWLIDPFDRKALSYSKQDPVGKLVDLLTTESPRLEIPLESLWKFLPEP